MKKLVEAVITKVCYQWLAFLWSSIFLYLGYNVLVSNFNLPPLSYANILFLRIGLSYLTFILGQIFYQRKDNTIEVNNNNED